MLRPLVNSNKFPMMTFLLSISLSFMAGCGSSSAPKTEEEMLDEDLAQIISEKQLRGDPSAGRTLPSIESPAAQLGMKLFFTKALSGEQDVACVTCHHPVLGGGDDLSLPVGVDAEIADLLGPGRLHSVGSEEFDGGPNVPRNAPSTFNIALWDRVLFHDGRVESLGKTPRVNGDDGLGIRTPDSPFGQADANAGNNLTVAQARFPVTSGAEMRNFTHLMGLSNAQIREQLEQTIGDYGEPIDGFLVVNNWLTEFRTGFSSPEGTAETLITYDNIAHAIAEYERSQIFVDTPWKSYVDGDKTALSVSAKRGAKLFFTSASEGGAGCDSCHSGDFFTDERFHNIAMPQVGKGKGDGDNGNNDFGRFRETRNEADRFAFRTPTLLNATVTGPWGHAGAYTSLRAVVKHHLDPEMALDNYDFSQLSPNVQAADMEANTQLALDKLLADRQANRPVIANVSLTDSELTDLIAFLESLTDPCTESRSCLAPWIPDAGDSNPDALRLNGIDNNGDYL